MHRTLGSIVALLVLTPAALAEDHENPWAGLDDEVAALAEGEGDDWMNAVHMGVFMRSFFGNYDAAATEVSGVELRHTQVVVTNDRSNRRLNTDRESGRWDWMLRGQLDDGHANLEEAWMRYRLCPHWAFGGGKFRGPVLTGLELLWWQTLMFDRSAVAQGFDTFDEGAWADYYDRRFGATLSVQNGYSGEASGHLYVMHFFFPFFAWLTPGGADGVLGTPWMSTSQRERAAQDDLGALLGFSWVKDDSVSDAEAILAEVRAEIGPWRGSLEVADLDEGLPPTYLTTRKSLASQLGVQMEPDTTPLSATVSRQLQGSLRPTLAARVELLDDEDDTRITTLEGSVRKIPFLQFHGGLMDISSDNEDQDELVVYIGMSLVDPFRDGE